MIEVTEVKIYPIKNPKEGSTLKAFAEITLNKEFVIKSIRVVDGSKGLFVGMPQTKGKNDEYFDLAFPVTKEARSRISDAILEKYAESAHDTPVSAGNKDETNLDW